MGILDKCSYNEKFGTYMTPGGIITFAAVAKKWKNRDKKDDDGQFALTLIIPPTADLSPLRKGVDKLLKEKGWTKKFNDPFHDANDKLDDDRMPDNFDAKGWIMLRSNTYQQRPGVIFANGDTVPEDELLEEVYNGRWARMTVKPSAYDTDGNRGVKLYLSNIQLLKHGEKWPSGGMRVNPEEEFEAVDLEDGDDSDAVFTKKGKRPGIDD